MTAIAYKDGIMAADELVAFDDIVTYNKHKARKVHGHLVGTAGKACPSDQYFDSWFFQKADKSGKFLKDVQGFLPPMSKKLKFETMVVDPKGRICVVDQTGDMEYLEEKMFAVGAGAYYCMGVMENGGTAKEAVAAAIKRSMYCKGKVRYVSL